MNIKRAQERLHSSPPTEGYTKHALIGKWCAATDGVLAVLEDLEAFWLWDLIASYQSKKAVRDMPFQLWTVSARDEQGRVTITLQKDTGLDAILYQAVHITTLPDEVLPLKLYVSNHILLLPSEW